MEGVVNKNGAYFGDNVGYLQTSCNVDFGNSGGPLVDENGHVVGICKGFVGDDATTYYYAVAIDQITAILTTLGIPFTDGNIPVTPAEPDEPDVPETTEPVETRPVPTTEATRPEIDIPQDVVMDEPDEADSNLMMILIIAAIVVTVIVVIVVIAVAGGKKKQPAPSSPATPANPMSSRGGFETAVPMAPAQNVGETTVLSGGTAGETTVLSSNVNGGTLVRKRTGEVVTINAESFVIGRERKDVHYCIADNNAVSRVHARLIVRNGVTYLTSMTDKNGTFVNNVKVLRNQEVALKNGDHITLANEELEYKS